MNIILMTSAAPATAPFSTGEKRPPLGVGYLISVLRNAGHMVYFFDPYLLPSDTPSDDFIREKYIDYVGLYSNTICYSNTLAVFEQLQAMREAGTWSGKIMVGGPHTSVGLDTIPDYVDHIVIGEGEISILKIVSGEETARVVHGEMVEDLDTLPMPAWSDFIHRSYRWSDHYVEKWPVYTMNTSRGCPFHCTFCSTQTIWGRGYRYMSTERVLHDVEYMMKVYGMKVAYFREDHFTLNMKRVRAFCDGIMAKNLPIDWMCESRADVLQNEDDVKRMAQAGCKWLYIGVESGSPRMLEQMKKGETVEQFVRAFELAHKYGIKAYASFVVGVPGETPEDIQQTYDLIDIIKPEFHCMNVYVGLPGSDMYDEVIEKKLYEYIDPWGMAYLKGHDKRVDLYYGGGRQFKIPAESAKVESKSQADVLVTAPPYNSPAPMEPRAVQRLNQIQPLDLDLDQERLLRALNQPREAALLENYVRVCLQSVYSQAENRRLALYGAGKHTQWLIKLLGDMSYALPVVIIDDEPKQKDFCGIPVCAPNSTRSYKLTDVIISSDGRHYQMHSHLKEHPLFDGIRIHDFYAYLPWAPYSKERHVAKPPALLKEPETIADEYDNRYAGGYRLKPQSYDLARAAALEHFIRKVMKVHDARNVMDYGAGNGLFLPTLETIFRQAELHCCDISSVALKQIVKRYPAYDGRCHMVRDNCADVPDDQFDVLISIETMEHVEELEAYIKDMYRILRPGGTLIWTTPCANPGSIEHLYAKRTLQIEPTPNGSRRWSFEDKGHIRRLKTAEIRGMLEQIGFNNVTFRMRSHLFSFLHVRSAENSWIQRHPGIIRLDYSLFRRLPNGASMIGGAIKK